MRVTVDLERLREEAETVRDNPDLWQLHMFAADVLLLVEAMVMLLRERVEQ
jgi:hypothetical protein